MNGQHTLYKIVSDSEWQQAEQDGVFRGSEIDHTDGFIHLSAPDQVVETARKHFAGQPGLVLVAVDAASLAETLRWEPSRDDALFPHVYGDLPLSAVVSVVELPLGEDGTHQFPPAL
jgi:uncharacterized protein (DUF952 family)